MINRMFGLIAGATLFAASAHAATLTEDFSGGQNGWGVIGTVTGGAAGGVAGSGATITNPATGGPGGTGDAYLAYKDAAGNFMHAVFGNGWSGDLTAYDGTMFSLDYQQAPVGTNNIATFGTLRVTGGGLTAAVDMIGNVATTAWQTGSILFGASSFGVAQSTWDTILANVTEIRFQVEGWNGVSETVGLDNVTLGNPAPVPLPAGSLLLLTGLGAIALGRRKKT